LDVGLTSDILGNSIQGFPDIGAYEYQSDDTQPTVTAFTIPVNATSLTITVSTFTATDNVGVTGYLLTESSTPPTASVGSWSGTAPTSYTFSTDGTKTLYAWAKDAAGNVSASLNDSIIITVPWVIFGIDGHQWIFN
ncbi:MAG: hypothetical protein PHT07_20995, partial [Paludibacter sp.]|nr:hypothetical protein [Paludibacter sp.]